MADEKLTQAELDRLEDAYVQVSIIAVDAEDRAVIESLVSKNLLVTDDGDGQAAFGITEAGMLTYESMPCAPAPAAPGDGDEAAHLRASLNEARAARDDKQDHIDILRAELDAARRTNAALREALRPLFEYSKPHIVILVGSDGPDNGVIGTNCEQFTLTLGDVLRAAALLGEGAPETGATGGEPPYAADRDALRHMNTNPDTDTYVITFGALRAMFADLERAAQ